ncbi:hypothetical protein D9758_008648 [Tetrapyrgos nigripes]|uniref:Peptidase A1 domain-containing protein n=1 Tax=Tetrapyrgos nigripes TaxID=182062 RepID=A0A8H5D6K9_9AGAR|nr:hypothetical protein D9758_008648 [Tetrapyrgos nigripes]
MWRLVCIFCLSLQAFASISENKGTENALHLPIFKKHAQIKQKRNGEMKAVGLGDFFDATYSVLMTIGGVMTPLVLDTGSSDLWVVSDSCQAGPCSSTEVPLYPQETFESTGLTVALRYGDSLTGTHAFGLVGKDSVNIAGMVLQDQLFASINDTDTIVLETGTAGIFGLGFPINSAIWFQTFSTEHPVSSPQKRYMPRFLSLNFQSSFPTLGIFRGDYPGTAQGTSSEESATTDNTTRRRSLSSALPSIERRQSSSSSWTPVILNSFAQTGPPLTRALAQLGLKPTFSVTLQRDTVKIGGNAGMLTLGGLPEGVDEDSLTWVNVRAYTPAEGGLPPPPDAPDEVYPIAWEVLIDAVYLNDEKLPESTLIDSGLSVSALIDTGNSLIRGPPDVVNKIYTLLGRNGHYPCDQPQNLAFEIGGKLFLVDPKDFGNQVFPDSLELCTANIVPTDVPVKGNGYQYSWNLGDPFLKSVLTSFHYGNISHPSQDPPRIGFLSTVPPDSDKRYLDAVEAASDSRNFPAIFQPAPADLPPISTNSDGVPQAIPTQTTSSLGGPNHSRLENGGIPGPIRRPFSNVEKIVGTAVITGAGIWLG